MQQPRFPVPVLWFFVFTFLLTAVGQGVNLYVVQRLSAGGTAGTAIEKSPVWQWRPYGFYITNAGPSFVGLLMSVSLYGIESLCEKSNYLRFGLSWQSRQQLQQPISRPH